MTHNLFHSVMSHTATNKNFKTSLGKMLILSINPKKTEFQLISMTQPSSHITTMTRDRFLHVMVLVNVLYTIYFKLFLSCTTCKIKKINISLNDYMFI